MACDDRQLTQAQRQQGFLQQQRSGVMQAVRPFTGSPTLPNLIDYINREMFPVLRQARGKLNEVYRQVTDNAPSANPLIYYFSTETANADPTVGRLRLDNATQELATTIRISETNGQLRDASPWLDVMAGGVTAPLGVITLSDATDPSRFIRFDLNTMTDQGAYWDLAVTPIESSHENPFVEDAPLSIGFIPGVAGTGDGATIPPSSVSPMGAYTVLGNPTGSTAAPTEIGPIDAMTVLGRASSAANVNDIGPPTGASMFLRVNTSKTIGSTTGTAPTSILWSSIFPSDLPNVQDGQIFMNVNGAFSAPLARNVSALAGFGTYYLPSPLYNLNVEGSDSLIVNYNGIPRTNPNPGPDINRLERAALTGDVTAAQNSNTTAFRNFTALSVLGRTANSTGAPADIAATAASGAVLRESGNALSFGTVATAGITNNAVTNAKLAQMAAATIKGRAVTAGTGDPQDLTGLQAGQIVRRGQFVADTTSSGTQATYAVASETTQLHFAQSAQVVLAGMTVLDGKTLEIHVETGVAGTVVLAHESGSAGAAAQRFRCPDGVDLHLFPNDTATVTYFNNRWRVTGVARAAHHARYPAFQTLTVAPGTYNDQAVNQNTHWLEVALNADGDAIITGIAQPPSNAGGFLHVVKLGANARRLILRHESSLSASANRIWTPNSVDMVFTMPQTGVTLQYTGRWVCVGRPPMYRRNSTGTLFYRSMLNVVEGSGISTTMADDSTNDEIDLTIGVATAGVTNAMLANMAAGTQKGRQIDAGTGAPVDLTGAEQGENYRANTRQTVSSVTGTQDIVLNDDTTILVLQLTGDATLRSMQSNATGDGRVVRIEHDSGAFTLTLGHNLGSPTYSPFFNPNLADLPVQRGATINVRSRSGFWRPEYPDSRFRVRKNSTGTVFDRGRGNLIEGSGVTLTVADDAANSEVDITVAVATDGVTDAMLRNSAGLSVIGRSANSTGDPADIVAANDGEVLRRSGTTLGFGTVATAGITNNAVTDAKLRQSAGVSVIGRSANSTGDVADITAASDNRALVRRSGALSFEQIVDGDIAAGTISLGKIVGIGANTLIGNNTSSSTNPVEISVGTTTVVGRVAGNIVAAQLVGAQITNGTITPAKLAPLSQSRIWGRAEGAGIGTVTELTPTEVVAIIDGENATWTGAHSFTGSSHTINTAGTYDLDANVVNIDSATSITLASGSTLTLAASSTVTVGSPLEVQNTALFGSTFTFNAVASTTNATENNFSVTSSNVVRVNGTSLLTGMVAQRSGQIVAIINASSSTILEIPNENAGSSAANRFILDTTSRWIMDDSWGLAIYDGTTSRWRLLSPDRTVVL